MGVGRWLTRGAGRKEQCAESGVLELEVRDYCVHGVLASNGCGVWWQKKGGESDHFVTWTGVPRIFPKSK